VTSTAPQALSSASTLQELVDLVPGFIRTRFKPILVEQYNLWTKINSLRSQTARLEEYVVTGGFPPEIQGSIKLPTFQFSKEVSRSDLDLAHKLAVANEKTINDARVTILKAATTAKQAELKYLLELTSDAALFNSVEILCSTTVRQVAEDAGIKLTDTGCFVVGSPEPQPIASEIKFFTQHYGTIVRRTAVLAHMSNERELLRKTAALRITDKASADIAMKDTPEASGSATVNQAIETSLENFAKKYNLDSLKSMHTLPAHNDARQKYAGLTLREKPSQTTRSEQSSETSDARWTERKTERQRKGEEACTEAVWEEGERKRRRQEAQKLARVGISFEFCSGDKTFHVCRESVSWPRTPRALLCTAVRNAELFLSVGIDSLRIHCAKELPCDVIDGAIHFNTGVFKLPGVTLTETTEYCLAFNGKFIFHSLPDPFLVHKAWKGFEKNVRWRYIFRDQPGRLYIRRFNIPSDVKPTIQDPGFERGLEAAKDLLLEKVAALQLTSKARFNPNLRAIRQELQSKSYLVLATDKNLGIAVVSKAWYISECTNHLSDKSIYEQISDTEVIQRANQVEHWIASLLASAAKNTNSDEFDIFVKYLLTRVTTENLSVPTFKGLPKVHKPLWNLRPIIPSHSWITAGASKVADYLLQPVLQLYSWVVHSTIEVINTVRGSRANRSNETYIVTGDVQSFYTNVPIAETISLIKKIVTEEMAYEPWKVSLIEICLVAVMNNNCFQYGDEFYRQINGIAMGTSVAPVFANIYAAQFEQDLDEWRGKGLLSYVRYIDDIKFIFEGSQKQLSSFLSTRHFGKLKVSWDIRSAWEETPFLDCSFFFTSKPGVTELQSKLFRKKMNKHQYIPWSSAHPESVKRSFVKAELTRFMIVSSLKSFFEESKEMFFMNLRRRGYPADKLVEYGKQVDYRSRSSVLRNSGNKRLEKQTPLLLPSSYNEVWNMLNLKDVCDIMLKTWVHDKVEIPDSLKGPIVKSLRRSENLYDKATKWNVETLHTMNHENHGGSKKRSFEDAFYRVGSRARIEALRPRLS
jgi:hypothetical protein